MFYYFSYISLSIQLKGKWVGTYSTSSGLEINFIMKVKKYQDKFIGFINSKKKNTMLPKKIIFNEIIPNLSYSILLPTDPPKEILAFQFNSSAPMNSITASSTSNDGKYDVSIIFSGEQQMEYFLYKKVMGEWSKYSLFVQGHELLQKPLMILFYILLTVLTSYFLFWNYKKISQFHNKKDI